MTSEELKTEMTRAFADVPYPGDGNIAPCPCEECDGIREDFTGQSSASLTPEVVVYHYESFPLLHKQAQHYFLPAYLACSIDDYDSDVTQFLLFNLASDWMEPSQDFTRNQRDAITAFLHFLRSLDERKYFAEEIKQALEIWGNDTN